MSATPPQTGLVTVFAKATAKPGKGDELEQLLVEARKSAESDAEPYTLTYRTSRHGDEFAIFEEYNQDIKDSEGRAGIAAHMAAPPFQKLQASGVVADIEIKFYNEFK
ncbi:SPOSA6832_02190 [Sporobolomyces salmonicolor]|uniref:SPOSA6832_02190-mRNA-1:cds n=1 Tax=Sporidiobolus salmonicolor TaxID=5005 RepID=A0A0D6ELQ5_SPOSA|nr:SPOSA6832_02190 [Sporobolomyces salmonicolor]